MYNIIKSLLDYTGSNQNNWVDSYIVQTCQVLIPMMIAFFIWCFTKIISYTIKFGSK